MLSTPSDVRRRVIVERGSVRIKTTMDTIKYEYQAEFAKEQMGDLLLTQTCDLSLPQLC